MAVDYDDILKILGEFGRYQKILFFCICLGALPAAFNNMTIVFLAAVPDHQCSVPSAKRLNLSTSDYLYLTIPLITKDGERVFDACHRYKRNYTGQLLFFYIGLVYL